MEEYLSNIKLANECADAYYIKDSPIATDEEYDILMSKIKEYEKHHPDNISKDSPTQKISNFKQSKFYKSTHLVRMWSMIDIFTIEELQEWLSKTKGDLATHIAVSERIRALQEILEESEDSKDGEG